jgi:hypothetical protein
MGFYDYYSNAAFLIWEKPQYTFAEQKIVVYMSSVNNPLFYKRKPKT